MNEKQVENKLTAAVKKAGGIAPKFVSPGFAGMPDRLILLPDGHIAFAELKAPGKLPTPAYRKQGTDCFSGLALRSMSLTTRSRLEEC
jgi:hypothetical protein